MHAVHLAHTRDALAVNAVHVARTRDGLSVHEVHGWAIEHGVSVHAVLIAATPTWVHVHEVHKTEGISGRLVNAVRMKLAFCASRALARAFW